MPDVSQLTWLFFRFTGRIDRTTYSWATLFGTILLAFVVFKLVTALPDSYFQDAAASTSGMPPLPATPDVEFWATVLLVVNLIYDWAMLALTAKRLHDIGRSGWWGLLLFVGGLFLALLLCVLPGNPGPNRYGSPMVRRDTA